MEALKIKVYEVDYKRLIFESMVVMHFSYISEENFETDIKVEIFDPFFDIKFIPGEYVMRITTNSLYWVGFEVDLRSNEEKLNLKSGFRVIIRDVNTGEVLYQNAFKTGYISNNMRQFNRNKSIDSKVAWIIGDSHAWSSFGGDNHRPTDLGGYFPVRSSMTSLTLNRFLKGDNLGYLNSLPINKNDLMVFTLGEIDLRHNIYKTSIDKNINLQFLVEKLTFDYMNLINKIKDLYDVKILVLSPNPPMRDNFLDLEKSDATSLSGTEEDRKFCFREFDRIFSSMNITDIKYLNWTKNYTCDDGLIDVKKLESGNHHIKDYQNHISEVDIFIKNNF